MISHADDLTHDHSPERPLLTLARLERHLFAGADILRGAMEASAFRDYLLAVLLLKWCSDEDAHRQAGPEGAHPAAFTVPADARWDALCADIGAPTQRTSHAVVADARARARASATPAPSAACSPGDRLNRALAALERANPRLAGVLGHIDFTRVIGQTRVPPDTLRALVTHFDTVRLATDSFVRPDLLGAAYEYLLREFADSAGKKAGEFYTPRAVVELMVRIVRPTAGMRIYDPCAGSGGMLLGARAYVTTRGGDPDRLVLAGQEASGVVWALAQLNMLFHGVRHSDIRNGDTLTAPLHVTGGALDRFDRVLSNPPFSQKLPGGDLALPERFAHGRCQGRDARADLMFVQHMLATLAPRGVAATVAPHGVLFRGRSEHAIRAGLVRADAIEAVIGLPANLFYGTAIPACVLVLRAPGGKPAARAGRVLFVDAERGFTPGRTQNDLGADHVEHIVTAFEAFADHPGESAVVPVQALADAEFDLSVRRWTDTGAGEARARAAGDAAATAIRAHIRGGIPSAEVHGALADLGLSPADIAPVIASAGSERERASGAGASGASGPRDDRAGAVFEPTVRSRADIAPRLWTAAGLARSDDAARAAVDAFWAAATPAIRELPGVRAPDGARAALIAKLAAALAPVALFAGRAGERRAVGMGARWWRAIAPALELERAWATRNGSAAALAPASIGRTTVARSGPLDGDALRAALDRELDRELAWRRDALIALLERWWDSYRYGLAELEAHAAAATSELDRQLRALGFLDPH